MLEEATKIYQEIEDALALIYEMKEVVAKQTTLTSKIPALQIALNTLSDKLTEQSANIRFIVETGNKLVSMKDQQDSIDEINITLDGLKEKITGLSKNNVEGDIKSILAELDKIKTEKPQNTVLGKQTHDLDMGGHSVINLKDELATVKFVEERLQRISVIAAGGGGVSRLAELYDITITSIANGEILVYDSASKKYINKTLSEAGIASTSHADTHTDGTDDIQDATAARKGLATAAQIAKLDGIEALADVTDATNVAAAGALMVVNIDDTPVNGVTDAPISSNWAFDHNAAETGVHGAGANDLVNTGDDVTAQVSAASTSASGKVEIATAAEVNTGTDATRAVSPDSLVGSNFGIRYVEWEMFIQDGTPQNCTTGNGKCHFHVPPGLNGMNLVYAHAEVLTAGTTGVMTIQVYNATQTVDMLTTALTIDSGETGSDTGATSYAIDAANDDIATNDVIQIDIDTVHTTPATGLIVTLGFQLP